MPKGELFINGVDAYESYKMSLEESGLSALMTPPPTKSRIESKYRKRHGRTTSQKNIRFDSRDLTLPVHIHGKDKTEFFANYIKFCKELEKGRLVIRTKYLNDVYRCDYISCQQFSEFIGEYAAFTLKLNEPDPTDRGEKSIYDKEDK